MPKASLVSATGVRDPLPWMLGAILGPSILANASGGNLLVTAGLPAAAALTGSGKVKSVGQGALAAVGLSLLGPMVQNATAGFTGGGSNGDPLSAGL